MPKKHRSTRRALSANNPVQHMYPVYAYRSGEPDPDPAHTLCDCGDKFYVASIPYGPLLACPECGRGIQHSDFVADEEPIFRLTREQKQEWLDLRYVSSHKRGSVLRLKLLLPPEPQVSVTMQGVSDGVVMGRPGALAALAAWSPRDREFVPRWANYGAQA